MPDDIRHHHNLGRISVHSDLGAVAVATLSSPYLGVIDTLGRRVGTIEVGETPFRAPKSVKDMQGNDRFTLVAESRAGFLDVERVGSNVVALYSGSLYGSADREFSRANYLLVTDWSASRARMIRLPRPAKALAWNAAGKRLFLLHDESPHLVGYALSTPLENLLKELPQRCDAQLSK